MDRLKGKRALITGGTSGIGLETARLFLHEGARVVVTGTNPTTLDAASKELGKSAVIVASDAGDITAHAANSTGSIFWSLMRVSSTCGPWRNGTRPDLTEIRPRSRRRSSFWPQTKPRSRSEANW